MLWLWKAARIMATLTVARVQRVIEYRNLGVKKLFTPVARYDG